MSVRFPLPFGSIFVLDCVTGAETGRGVGGLLALDFDGERVRVEKIWRAKEG